MHEEIKCKYCNTIFIKKNSRHYICSSHSCFLKKKQELRNSKDGKEKRHKYYLDNKDSWVGRHGLSKREAREFVKDRQCEICGKESSLIVDHCHKTNVIRGVLCGTCNTAIGLLGDTFEGVKKAYDYLLRFRN